MDRTPDWSTRAGLAEIREAYAAQIPSWRAPVAYAVGLTPASSDPEWEFAHVNTPGGAHGLAAVILATVLGHDGSTATLPISVGQLETAIATLAPARACVEVEHPNLAGWESARAALRSNPMREAVAVFVADLEDPVSSEADASLRARLDGRGAVEA